MEELTMASFPAQAHIQHYRPSATVLQWIDAILEESPTAILAISQQPTTLVVNLINASFLGKEAPDKTAALSTLLHAGCE